MVNSTVRAVVTTLKSGEKCGVEPELVGKGMLGPGTVRTPAWLHGAEVLLLGAPKMGPAERSGRPPGRPHPQQVALAWAQLLGFCACGELSPSDRLRPRATAHRWLPWTGLAGALLALGAPGAFCPGVRWSGACLSPSWRHTEHTFCFSAVLRGLIEVGSPHLEELLAALFATAPTSPTLRPVAVVSSLLLQEKEPPAPGEPEADSCR